MPFCAPCSSEDIAYGPSLRTKMLLLQLNAMKSTFTSISPRIVLSMLL